MKKLILHLVPVFLLFIMGIESSISRDYIIYSVALELPMGEPNEVLKKNYYVNIGERQGVKEGTVLDVYRVISRLDAFNSNIRHNHRVKIGEITILHTEEESSIGKIQAVRLDDNSPLFEIDQFIIGDRVSVHVSSN